MHLLTLKRLALHSTNHLVNVALKFYFKFNFMQFQLLKEKTQSVQACCICTTFRYNPVQFRRVEVPSLGHHMVNPRLSYPLYEIETAISHSNLIIYKH